MATYKELSSQNIKTAKSFLSQLIDVVQEDVSGSTTRKKYTHFVTGGVGPGISSSLFQTVYDQDHSLQTANAMFDMTVGLFYSGSTVQGSKTGEDANGKLMFPSSSVMMREKLDIYRQFAQNLLGDATSQFAAPFDSTATANLIDAAMFICFKRLFSRDQIKRETFAMRFYQSASISKNDDTGYTGDSHHGTNLWTTSESGSMIYTDVGAGTNKNRTYGGTVGSIVQSTDTSYAVGLLFYERGIAVLDLAKICSGSQFLSGSIDAMNSNGTMMMGSIGTDCYLKSNFIPHFMVSASIDDIVDHLASTRFSSGSLTGITFQNITNINSTLIFCRAEADEFNYSSNPTYRDDSDRLRVIDVGSEEVQRSFVFVSTVGLYDAHNNLLAVAKLSRPVEKNAEKELTVRVRLDY